MHGLQIAGLKCEYKVNPLGIDTARPRLSWEIRSEERNMMQTSYRIQVSEEDPSFANPSWDSGEVHSDRSVHVVYEGPALKSRTKYYYRVRIRDNKGRYSDWSDTNHWESALLQRGEWAAEWITSDLERDSSIPEPCLMMRRTFDVTKNIKRARLYATALGLYELRLNGQRVGDAWFAPGWTSYNHRLQYQTYDVTELLNTGSNTVGAIVGDGWYKGNIGWKNQRNRYGDTAAFLCQLHIGYDDGTEQVVLTDRQWTSSTGPIRLSEIYHGEMYDARMEQQGWDTAGYDASDWAGTNVVEQTKDILIAQENVPVRIVGQIKPLQVIRTPTGETVLDMGQNMVGWMHFKVKGKAGEEVVLLHAEVLDREGNFYTGNLRSAQQTVRYILKGGEEETFEPHFTFQGFRYVKVESWSGELDLQDFTGKVIHSDMEPTGHFECSEPMINQLQHNIVWGQKGNFLDVPTDCPQRDERLGWTGDAQVFIRTAAFNMNVAPFFAKWSRDLQADQFPDGGVPFVVPDVLEPDNHSSSAWGDAAVICPWTIYECYGDKSILEEQYASMKAWVEYIRNQGDNEHLWNTGFHFGDWLGLDAKENSYVGATPRDLIATAFYAYSTCLFVKTAEVLGKADDVREYGELHRQILRAFRNEFVTPNGRLAAATQTAHVLALMFDLLEEKDRSRAAYSLAELVKENRIHLTTGFVGTPYLCHVLTRYGYHDLACQLVLQKDYPSWLYSITKGATTIWEHWDGIKEDGTFWSDSMNSYNHYAYGAVGDWLYRRLAGMDTDVIRPGYKHIHIAPLPGQGFSYAKATLHSMYGEIRSEWETDEQSMKVTVTIPANTTATVMLPFSVPDNVRESGIRLTDAEGIRQIEPMMDTTRMELGSGTYVFVYPKK